jgi:hypothetical protein
VEAIDAPATDLSTSTTITAQRILYHPRSGATQAERLARRYGDYTNVPPLDDTLDATGAGQFEGYWTWWDTCEWVLWVDTGTKSGLLIGGQEGIGTIDYIEGGADASIADWKNYIRVYALSDIAEIAAGTATSYSKNPAAYFRADQMDAGHPRFRQAWGAWQDGSNNPIFSGAAFDPATKRLYLSHRMLDSDRDTNEPNPMVLVYQLP